MQLRIQNFQSIEDVSLEISGLTILMGRSNIGKSAIVRAVEAAVTGAPVTDYVRHGLSCERVVKNTKTCQCFTSVSMEAPGFSFLWEKGDAKHRYVLNGHTYSAVDRGAPAFLGDYFKPLKVGDGNVIVQVASQFYPLFLLDQSSFVVADVFADIAQLDDVNAAIKLLDKDRKAVEAERKVRDADLVLAQTELNGFDGFEELHGRCLNLIRRRAELTAAMARLSEVSILAARLQNLRDRITEIQALVDACEVPSVSKSSFLLETIRDCGQRLRSHPLVTLPVLPDNSFRSRFTVLDLMYSIRGTCPVEVALELPSVDRVKSLRAVIESAPTVKKYLEVESSIGELGRSIGVCTEELGRVQSELSQAVCSECGRPL